jgi:hypothetical protein
MTARACPVLCCLLFDTEMTVCHLNACEFSAVPATSVVLPLMRLSW